MKKSSLFALTLACFVGGLIPAEAIDGKHVNGYVVSARWRSGTLNWTPNCCECGEGSYAGDILLYTLQDGRTSRVDTLYKRIQGLGQYPEFDIEGKRIAFYRWSLMPQPGDSGYSSDVALWGSGKCLGRLGSAFPPPTGGPSYLAVMNRDGSNLRNLITLRDKPYNEMALAWPAGDWIYYINPKVGRTSTDRHSSEIRKVNVLTGEDQLVYQNTISDFKFTRFTLSANGTRGGIMGQSSTYNLNAIVQFPPSGSTFSVVVGASGCNAAVSASGTYIGSYFAGAHTEVFLGRSGGSGLPCITLFPKPELTVPKIEDVSAWLGGVFSGSEGCEQIRWAVNSDKWIQQQVGWWGHASTVGLGSNTVALNWIDRTAIMESNNPRQAVRLPERWAVEGAMYYGNGTGSMWIDGGQENLGKIEDTAGVWHAISGYIPTSIAGSHHRTANYLAGVSIGLLGSKVHLTLPAGKTYQVTIVNARGSRLSRRSVAGTTALHDLSLAPGVYQVVASHKNEAYRSSVTVLQ